MPFPLPAIFAEKVEPEVAANKEILNSVLCMWNRGCMRFLGEDPSWEPLCGWDFARYCILVHSNLNLCQGW